MDKSPFSQILATSMQKALGKEYLKDRKTFLQVFWAISKIKILGLDQCDQVLK